jgi:CRISPR-associated protein Cas1
MVNRIVEIAENGQYICKQRGFISVKKENEVVGQVATEDIGVLMLTAFGVTITKEALVALSDQGAVTILCGNNYLPAAFVIPAIGNYEAPKRIRLQLLASLPLKKRLWQSLVTEKLNNQAKVLRSYNSEAEALKLEAIARHVLSGDPSNTEAQGARLYWPSLFGKDFRRDPEGKWPNAPLNYGYAILRSSLARAICCAGLLPVLGIHHGNDTNPFPLADDLMEVYRPLVDYYVKGICQKGEREMTPTVKQGISALIWADLRLEGQNSPFYNAVEYLVGSFVESLKAKTPQLRIAQLPDTNHDNAKLI